MHPAWQLLRFAVWWNGLGGAVIGILVALAVTGVIAPFGFSDFPMDNNEHLALLGIGIYLSAIWAAYMLWWRNSFADSSTVRWRLLCLLLLTFLFTLGLAGHQSDRLRDDVRTLRANQARLLPN